MLYKTIPIMERADGSLQIDTNKVKLTQGDYNFNINYFTKEDYSDVSPIVNVQVSFRRKDGQQTGWLPLTHIRGNQYIINLKSTWFTKVEGSMYVTFRVFQTTSSNVNLIINTTSGTLIVNPTYAFNTPEPDIIPSEFEIYMSQTNEAIEDLRNDLALSQLGKGIFDNEQELLATYPNGADYPEGTWAVLLSTNTVWLYNSTTKTWYNSNRDVTDIFDLDDKVYRFAKQLYEESLNLLYGLLTITGKSQNNVTYSLSNGTLNVNGTPSANTFEYLTDYITLKAGTYFFTFESEKVTGCRLVTGDGSSTATIAEKNKPFTLTTDRNDIRVQMRLGSGSSFDGATYTNFGILEGDWTGKTLPNYGEYNAKSHITNTQAEFLKDENEKKSNIFDLEHSTYKDGQAYTTGGTLAYWNGYCRFEDYVKVKENTNYSLAINGLTNIYSTIVYYNSNQSVISQVGISNGKFTTPSNCAYIRFACQKLRTEITSIMLNEGDYIGTFDYNSSSHITNPQADFLKNENERSLNELKIFQTSGTITQNGCTCTLNEDGTFTLNGAPTATAYFEFVYTFGVGTNAQTKSTINLDKTKTYNMSLHKISGSVGDASKCILNIGYLNNGSETLKAINLNDNNLNVSGYDGVGRAFIVCGTGIPFNNLVVGAMLVESDVMPTKFSGWEGPIIREKHIKPVLVWENGSKNSGFDGQDIDTSYVPSDCRVLIEFKGDTNNWRQRNYTEIYKDNQWGETIEVEISTTINGAQTCARRLYFLDHNKIRISVAYYSDGSTSKWSFVPTRIWYLPNI